MNKLPIPIPRPTPYSWINHSIPGPSSGVLAGKSIAIKDNISYTKAPTSCSSSVLKDYTPPYDATCVTSLLSAGAHISGQTKMDEFGMGSTTTHLPPDYSPVYNPSFPSDPSEAETQSQAPRVAGGSSGGSAAAVAEGSCWAALGTDTGGSVRLPASYCGVVGLKPSYGMISRYGVVSYADSMDCVGILGKTTKIVKSVFDTISHPDMNDMTCLTSKLREKVKRNLETHYPVHGPKLETMRIGILALPSNLPKGMEMKIPPIPPSLISHLRSKGATFHTVSLPNLSKALPAYYVLASAEAASNLGRFGGGWFGSSWESESEASKSALDDGQLRVETGEERRRRIRDSFGREVKKRILAGTYALTADAFNNSYLKALHLRRLVREDFERIFRVPHPLLSSSSSSAREDGIDVLLHPTAVGIAPLHPNPPLQVTPSNLSQSTTNINTAGDDQGKRSTSSDNTTTLSNQGQEDDERAAQNTIQEYVQDLLTVPASLAGLPALNVPGSRIDGWPVGMSLVTQYGMEEVLFGVGGEMEDWEDRA